MLGMYTTGYGSHAGYVHHWVWEEHEAHSTLVGMEEHEAHSTLVGMERDTLVGMERGTLVGMERGTLVGIVLPGYGRYTPPWYICPVYTPGYTLHAHRPS